MSPNPPLTLGVDSPAETLRRLATRAHRVLRQGRAGDRHELIALLDEIARSRRLLDGVVGDELADWFDRLEAQVAGLLGRLDNVDALPGLDLGHAEPASACRVGMA